MKTSSMFSMRVQKCWKSIYSFFIRAPSKLRPHNLTWGGRPAGFLGSPLEEEGVLVGGVVGGERSPTSGGGRSTQLRGGETHLSRAGAWPSCVPEGKLLPRRVDWVPGTCRRRVSESREVMVAAEGLIGAGDVLTVDRQRLSQVSDRLRVVHFLRPGAHRCVKCGTEQKSDSWDHPRSPSIPRRAAASSSLRFSSPVQGDFTHLYRFTAKEFKSTSVTSPGTWHPPAGFGAMWGHWPWFPLYCCWNMFIKPVKMDPCGGQCWKHSLTLIMRFLWFYGFMVFLMLNDTALKLARDDLF